MSALRHTAHVLLAVALALLTVLGVAVAGMTALMRSTPAPQPDSAAPWPEPAPSSDGPLAVAVVLGQSGTVASDALAPYEVFARSPHFSVFTVAETDSAVRLGGGPATLPTFTFTEVDTGAAAPPDIVVVPAVTDPTGVEEWKLRDWIVQQADRGAHILGVCAGSRVLAAAGLLDGRRATSHWDTIKSLEADHPEVDWLRGRRYVQDGPITTTAGITSGIPAALQLVHDLAGPSEAQRVGRAVRYPDWSPESSNAIPAHRFAASDVPMTLARALPWLRPTYGIGLTDGISELDVAAAFEVYDIAAAARVITITPGGGQ